MSLSDKISKSDHPFHVPTLFEKDVREAVKKLKDICNKNDGYCSIDDINEIFGSKLT